MVVQAGWTPLQVACWENQPRVVAEIVKLNPNLEVKDAVRFNVRHAISGDTPDWHHVVY